MSAIVRMGKAFNCLNDFRDCCDNEHKKLIDIFIPMLYKENKHRLEISIGKRIDKEIFRSLLSTIINNFNVKLCCYDNNPQFIIEDTQHRNTITLFNLGLIYNLQIEEDECDDFCRYRIYFNYNNEIDYCYCVHIIK